MLTGHQSIYLLRWIVMQTLVPNTVFLIFHYFVVVFYVLYSNCMLCLDESCVC